MLSTPVMYISNVEYLDEFLGALFSRMKEAGLYDDAIIVITSDHGEEFWDHARFGHEVHTDPRKIAGIGHGQSLFGELTDVPLIFSGPGVPSARVASLVRNIDLRLDLVRLREAVQLARFLAELDLRTTRVYRSIGGRVA